MELEQFNDPVLHSVLPAKVSASDNAGGQARSAHGYVFPPYLVLQRGLPLKDWAQEERRTMEVWGMVEALAALLAHLHSGGLVHRDLKPANVLAMQNMQWRLLDMGVVARAGARCRIGIKGHLICHCMAASLAWRA